MSERYFITGVQLGLLHASNKRECVPLIHQIMDNQFIGNFPTKDDKIRFEKMMKKMTMTMMRMIKNG